MEGKKQNHKGRFMEKWMPFTIKTKLNIFAGAVVLTIGLTACLNIFTVNFALYGFGPILDDNAKCYAFQEAMENETKAFEKYMRSKTEENKADFLTECTVTVQRLEELPFSYEKIGASRYAKTWSIQNAYQVYQKARNQVSHMKGSEEDYIASLYEIYSMQEYLETYAKNLVQLTLQEGNQSYLSRVPLLNRLPWWLFGFGAVLAVMILFATYVTRASIVKPIELLAGQSRRIAQNDFSGEDIQIESKDEMSELVHAFNKMKHATRGYIEALEDKHEITEKLHKEELERVELEKILESTRLEVLKSQINPHFLFNTLNMISCMAKLEEADTTERMITSMSNLFRYNLKTSETEVPLAQELKVVDDYLYIQQMRFGSRIQYRKEILVDQNRVIIPSFSLQPIVENAIIHGISKKEQGGFIIIRVWNQGEGIVISIADTGVGMSSEHLEALRQACGGRKTSRIGIGLGNIYKRIHMLYKDADLQIYSREGRGTVIQMKINTKL